MEIVEREDLDIERVIPSIPGIRLIVLKGHKERYESGESYPGYYYPNVEVAYPEVVRIGGIYIRRTRKSDEIPEEELVQTKFDSLYVGCDNSSYRFSPYP